MMTARRLLGHLLVLTVISLSGCVDERAFYIEKNLFPEGDCLASAGATLGQSGGLLDITGPALGYYLFPLVKSEIPSSQQIDPQQPERNRLRVTAFKVDIDLRELASATIPPGLLAFETAVAGNIDPNGTSVFSGIRIVPTQLVPMLKFPSDTRPQIIAKVRVVAKHGGRTIESEDFLYPIELCTGCLVDFRPQCPTAGDPSILPAVCPLPQDEPVTCCDDPNRGMICLTGGTN